MVGESPVILHPPVLESFIAFWKHRGFNVIPIPKGRKAASLKWKRYQTVKYEGGYPEGCNIAVVTGSISGNLIVVDCDSYEAYEKMFGGDIRHKTIVVFTGSGRGVHVYLKTDNTFAGFNTRLSLPIDIKCEGGYAVTAPSIHPSGGMYEIAGAPDTLEPIFIENVEKFIVDKLKEMGWKGRRRKPKITSIAEGIPEGMRNESAFSYARYLIFDRGFDGHTVEFELKRWNQGNKPPLPERELMAVLESATKYPPSNFKHPTCQKCKDVFTTNTKLLKHYRNNHPEVLP